MFSDGEIVMSQRSIYDILGVSPDAEDIVIRAAYKALAQRYHPDKWAGDKEDATRRMAELNHAYSLLSDPRRRRKYDERIKPSASREQQPVAPQSAVRKDETIKPKDQRDNEDFLQKKWQESGVFGRMGLFLVVTLVGGAMIGIVRVAFRLR